MEKRTRKQLLTFLLMSLFSFNEAFSDTLGGRPRRDDNGNFQSSATGRTTSNQRTTGDRSVTDLEACKEDNHGDLSHSFINFITDNGLKFERDKNSDVINGFRVSGYLSDCMQIKAESSYVDGKIVVHLKLDLEELRSNKKGPFAKAYNALSKKKDKAHAEAYVKQCLKNKKLDLNNGTKFWKEAIKKDDYVEKSRLVSIPIPRQIAGKDVTSEIVFASPKVSEHSYSSDDYKLKNEMKVQCHSVHKVESGDEILYGKMSKSFALAKDIERHCRDKDYAEALRVGKDLENSSSVTGVQKILDYAREQRSAELLKQINGVLRKFDTDDMSKSAASKYSAKLNSLLSEYDTDIVKANVALITDLQKQIDDGDVDEEQEEKILKRIETLSDQIYAINELDDGIDDVYDAVAPHNSLHFHAKAIKKFVLRSEKFGNYNFERDDKLYADVGEVNKAVNTQYDIFEKEIVKDGWKLDNDARKGKKRAITKVDDMIKSNRKDLQASYKGFQSALRSKLRSHCTGIMTSSKTRRCYAFRSRIPIYQSRYSRNLRNSGTYRRYINLQGRDREIRNLYYESQRRSLASSGLDSSISDFSFMDSDIDMFDTTGSFFNLHGGQNDFLAGNQPRFNQGNMFSMNPRNSMMFGQQNMQFMGGNNYYNRNPHQMYYMNGANPMYNPFQNQTMIPGQQQFMTPGFGPSQYQNPMYSGQFNI